MPPIPSFLLSFRHFYFFTSTLQSSVSSHLKKFNSLSLNYVEIISLTTVLFSLSLIFHHSLLAAAMLNLSFSSNFFIIATVDYPSNLPLCQPTPCYKLRSYYPCNRLQVHHRNLSALLSLLPAITGLWNSLPNHTNASNSLGKVKYKIQHYISAL